MKEFVYITKTGNNTKFVYHFKLGQKANFGYTELGDIGLLKWGCTKCTR
ncbi:MAG: hypothetical protein N2V76_08635 [Methanophagales archaeon]|nr:hypothetical protein [Methanophagales archaeon]